MKLILQRSGGMLEYEVPLNDITLLEALGYIKENIDHTLAYSLGCRSSVCGSCAVRVNEVEVLACAYKPKEGDLIQPLQNMKILRDLAVDMDKALAFNKTAKAWGLPNDQTVNISKEDAKRNELQSDCILCSACFSACPVYAVNEDFIGPFALTRALRYVNDVRQKDINPIIEAIQANGIYDCTLCNECVPVCPQSIAPKQDIEMLRNKSGMLGYLNPNFSVGFDDGLSF